MQRQEFVIGGFTEPAGTRVGLGALLLGVYDPRGQLRYAGRVGTGFNDSSLRQLRARLDKIARSTAPFADPPKGREAAGVHWVEPRLVGEVAFSEWTQDNLLRHPSFQGLREDKAPGEIYREKTAHLQAMRNDARGASESAEPTQAKRRARKSAVRDSRQKTQDGDGEEFEIAGIQLTHPERILYPEQNISKRDLAIYYQQIADWMLPQLERRPVTLVRCPQGHGKHCFYQRHVSESLHRTIHTVSVREGKSTGRYVWIDSLAGLVALVQMGVLEIHVWNSRVDRIDHPDQLIFDLDPDASISWQQLVQAAQNLRNRLSALGLSSFAKTTGGKGLHVVVPITPRENWELVKDFTRAVADRMAREEPARYTATMSKTKRRGKIYIDYLRNARAASAICAYSTRAFAGAPVSAPVRWNELESDVRGKFDINTVRERLTRLKRAPWPDFDETRVPINRAMLKRL
jgi:bifunctional non-homologous end joining protein LigD